MKVSAGTVAVSILILAAAASAIDLGTYKGCAAGDGDFKRTELFKGPAVTTDAASNGLLKLAFVAQSDASVDVYFVQKQGAVKRYNGKDGTVDALGTIPNVDFHGEYGLVGIAVSKDFLKKPEIFMMYSIIEAGSNHVYHISRFKLTANLAGLDLASEKILIKIPRKNVTWHTSGSMVFDDYGDLWIAVGDNQQTETGPANTADLRGGIMRIHPDDSPKGYSIPAGNFGAHMSAYFKAQGNNDLATQYADTSKVKAETYVKGTRNAYTIDVDPVRRYLVWGDVGPDQGKVSEEANLVKQPYYTGWPYFAGDQDMGGVQPYDFAIPRGSLKTGPVNNLAGLAGVKQLPPVRDPIFSRIQGCSMSGPIFRYNGALANTGQFPPQFHRKWMISGCDGYGFHLLTLDEASERVLTNTKIFAQFSVQTLVDLKQGPDGALYYISWNTGLYRIDYTGTCKDASLVLEKTGCGVPGFANYDAALPKEFNDSAKCEGVTSLARAMPADGWLRLHGRSLFVKAPGRIELEIVDAGGRVLFGVSGEGPKQFQLPEITARGIYRIRVKSDLGTEVRRLPLVGL
jgi:glucose/arabinose dehydrogenase